MAFHSFEELPTELRIAIWDLALPDARIVEIEWCDALEEWYSPKQTRHRHDASLAHVNRESRSVFLKIYYELCWQRQVEGKVDDSGIVHCSHEALEKERVRCYPNPDIDSLYIGPSFDTENCARSDTFEALEQMGIAPKLRFLLGHDEEFWHAMMSSEILDEERDPMDLQLFFPKLESFTLVVGDVGMEFFDGYDKPTGRIELLGLTGLEYFGDDSYWLDDLMETLERLKVALNVEMKKIRRGGILMWRPANE